MANHSIKGDGKKPPRLMLAVSGSRFMKSIFSQFLILSLFSGVIACSHCCPDVWIQDVDFQALQCCKEKASNGDAEAQFEYGLWLMRLPDEHKNVLEGIEWLRKSAKNKYFMAQVALGMFLSVEEPECDKVEESEIEPDLVEAYAWLSTARQYSEMKNVENRMNIDEIVKAKKMSSEYIKKYSISEMD